MKISEFTEMNDPLELAGVRLSDPEVQEILVGHFQRRVGVLCFSAAWSHPLLWAHYADCHAGMCLGFRVHKRVDVHRTRYVKRKRTIDVEGLKRKLLDVTSQEDRLRLGSAKSSRQLMERILSTKFAHWRYEREMRAFVSLNQKDGDHYFCDFDKNFRLERVIVGYRSEVLSVEIEQALEGYGKRVEVFRASPAPTAFRLVKGGLRR